MTAIAKVAEINEAFRELAAEELDRVAGGWPGSNWAWGTTTTTGISGESRPIASQLDRNRYGVAQGSADSGNGAKIDHDHRDQLGCNRRASARAQA
jgi:hypothetical protein